MMNYYDILGLSRYCAKVYETQSIIGTPTDTEVLIDKQPDKIIIAFCGSESLVDWKQNADFALKAFPLPGSSKVHSGFLECFLSVKYQLLNLLENEQRSIFLTGHSLGGAIATLAAVDFKMSKYAANINCVTFGSPKPGNKSFAQLYSDLEIPTLRVINSNDIVPTLPKWWQGGWYHHVCPAYQIGSIDKFFFLNLKSKIKNHYIINYVAALEQEVIF